MKHPAERVRRSSSSLKASAIRYSAVALGLLTLTGLGAWSVSRLYSYSSAPSSANLDASPSWTFAGAGQGPINQPERAKSLSRTPPAVYPYSVVPGGVQTPEELQAAGERDHAVAMHYAGFNFGKARVIQVRQAKLVYVSYRIGENIFWTKKRMSLRIGEKLITDGNTTARVRCGNQISEGAHFATSPAEPSVEALDRLIAEPAGLPVPFESALLHPSGFTPAALPPPGGGFPPGLSVPPPIGGAGCAPGRSCFNPPPPGPPPVNMAEPDEPSLLGSVILFWLGVAGICFQRWRLGLKRG